MKKLLVFILALVMLFSVFACTKNEGKKPADTTVPGTTTPAGTTPGETTPGVTTTPEPEISIDLENDDLDLPKMTFDGKKMRISSTTDYVPVEVFVDETAINIREQALWVRNEKIKDEYGVQIEPYAVAPSTVTAHVEALLENIMSGDDFFDLALTSAHSTGVYLISGYLVNWLNMQYNDFSKLYWRSDINDKFTFDDALYTAVGDMCISVLTNTYAMFYNRTKGDQMFVADGVTTITEEVLQKIDDMTWTYDYFVNLISNIYTDLDYEAGPSIGDFYGYSSDLLCALDTWQFAFDIPMLEADTRKVFKLVFDDEKSVEMVDKLSALYWETNGSYNHNDAYTTFAQGKVLFSPQILGYALSIFRNMEDDYSILPYPLWDEDQDMYMTGAQDNYRVLSIPTTAKNVDMVSYIVEVLNYESRETLYPVYYEESLKKQAARDPETIEMLNIVVAGCNFDLGTMFHHATGGLPLHIRHAVSQQKSFKEIYDGRSGEYSRGILDVAGRYRLNKNNGAK